MKNDEALSGIVQEVRRFSLFKELASERVLDLFTSGKVCISKHREQLFSLGDQASYFAVVVSGGYKLSKPSIDGDDVIVHFCMPGDVIAALIMAQQNSVYPVNVISMGPSRAILIKRESYLKYWLTDTQLVVRIQNLLSNRITKLQGIKMMQRAPLTSRIASLLLQLSNTDGPESDTARHISVPLTRKEIADVLGVTVESVIRVMSEWNKNGIVQSIDKEITILRPHDLIISSKNNIS
ncbi:MAG: Crp/Fnr family transcriptional regulator [Oligoflexia bacterium]|nr:Crp/Fnr family transcriptional regulator [Oligoflexia bacterium]